MADKITKFLTSLDPNTLTKLLNLAPELQPTVSESTFAPVAPTVSVAPIDQTVTTVYYDPEAITLFGIVVTTFIIIWYLLKISIKFVIDDQKTKENFEYIDNFLFGNTGLLSNLFILWVILISGINVFKLVNYIISTTTNFTPSIKLFPNIIDKIIALIKTVKSIYSLK
jgi:hypothetical protein